MQVLSSRAPGRVIDPPLPTELLPQVGLNLHRNGAEDGATTALPCVTVAIACFNQARYLSSAIESVLTQSYANVEIVVVDDGSTDNTAEVAARYPGARYIRQENQGLSGARNTGWREGRGDYVVFLDADDRLLPRALEVGMLCMAAKPECAFVSGHFRYIDNDGAFLHEYAQTRIRDGHYAALLRGNYIGMHASVMYRRTIFAQVGEFDRTLPACEDYDLYLRIAREFPVYCHDEVIAEYRQHGTNLSGNPSLMLHHAVGVLRRHWSYVQRDPAWKRAYWVGVLAWQAHYGRKFFERAAQLRAQGKPREAVRHLLPVLWQTPLYSAYHAGEWLWWQGYGLLYKMIPPAARPPIAQQLYRLRAPKVGHVRMGDLSAKQPKRPDENLDAAQAPGGQVDDAYIANFIAGQAHYLRGKVLVIGDMAHAGQFLGERVTEVYQLHLDANQAADALVDDLRAADKLSADHFDCILVIQAMHRVFDLQAAVRTLHRLLKPGGVLLVTLPGIGLVKRAPDVEAGYWAFTDYAARQLFVPQFSRELVRVETQGNVLATVAQLQGVGVDCLRPEELAYTDPQFQRLITVRAIKAHDPRPDLSRVKLGDKADNNVGMPAGNKAISQRQGV